MRHFTRYLATRIKREKDKVTKMEWTRNWFEPSRRGEQRDLCVVPMTVHIRSRTSDLNFWGLPAIRLPTYIISPYRIFSASSLPTTTRPCERLLRKIDLFAAWRYCFTCRWSLDSVELGRFFFFFDEHNAFIPNVITCAIYWMRSISAFY